MLILQDHLLRLLAAVPRGPEGINCSWTVDSVLPKVESNLN